VVSHAISIVVDEFYAKLKGRYVFKFLDDLVVYSSSPEEHETHVREVLSTIQRSGFTLNSDKVGLGASVFKYLGQLTSARGIKILCEKVTAIQDCPLPVNLRSLMRFIGMVGFYAEFIRAYGSVVVTLHDLRKKGVLSVGGRRIRRRSIL